MTALHSAPWLIARAVATFALVAAVVAVALLGAM